MQEKRIRRVSSQGSLEKAFRSALPKEMKKAYCGVRYYPDDVVIIRDDAIYTDGYMIYVADGYIFKTSCCSSEWCVSLSEIKEAAKQVIKL